MNFGGFPFGMGGDDFMGGRRGARRRPEVDNKKMYDTLGLPSTATQDEIKKAYKKLAIQHHPDKGGDADKFKEISRAYDCLGDPEKRRKYDEYGEEGLEAGGEGGGSDFFEMFFPGGRREKRPDNVVSELKCPLEQVYKGCNRKLAINRDVVCEKCRGLRAPKDCIEICTNCSGRGVVVTSVHLGPIVQQTSSHCGRCEGRGKYIHPDKRCKSCKGEGTVKERKVLDVYIEKGAPVGHKITFRGEADERPDEPRGDVIFVVAIPDHPIFHRKGADLFIEREISLYEALTGYKLVLTHLDGRQLLIKSAPREVTRPEDVKAVAGEGMPIFKSPHMKGNLFIKIKVRFPSYDELHGTNSKFATTLKSVLIVPPQPAISESDPDVEVHQVTDIDPAYSQRQQSNKEAYEEDDEEGGHPGSRRVQCAQQ